MVQKVGDMSSVPQNLRDSAALFEERNRVYGDSINKTGEILMKLFPGGIALYGPLHMSRFYLISMLVNKLARFSNCMEAGHPDSLDDITVYAQMLKAFYKQPDSGSAA